MCGMRLQVGFSTGLIVYFLREIPGILKIRNSDSNDAAGSSLEVSLTRARRSAS
jgi:hypothetical protein